jgi:hypothetical protein
VGGNISVKHIGLSLRCKFFSVGVLRQNTKKLQGCAAGMPDVFLNQKSQFG